MSAHVHARRMTNRLFLALLAGLAVAGAAYAAPKDSGPTQKQIDCKNRAVNDYWTEVASCESVLSDLPNDLQQCKADALDDLRRDKAACMAARIRADTTGERAPASSKAR